MVQEYNKQLPQTSIRKLRYGEILNFILDCSVIGKGIEKERLISEFCIRYGASRRKVVEYINDLVNTSRIKEIAEGKKIIYLRDIPKAIQEEIKNGV